MKSTNEALRSAIAHHQVGRLAEAERLYRENLAREPKHADALHFLGAIACQVGKHGIGADLIRQSIALNPNDAEAHSNLGGALISLGRFHDATAAFRRAISINSKYAQAYFGLGNALSSCGKLDEAIVAYRRAILLVPKYAAAYDNLGNALNRSGQLDEAIIAYRQAITLAPEIADTHGNLGTALTAKGDFDGAVTECRRAIELNPNQPEAHNNLGNALRGMGRLDEAVSAYRQAIHLDPRYALAYDNLANLLGDTDHLDETIACRLQVSQLSPNSAEAHFKLGGALKIKGDLDSAMASYRRAIELNQSYWEALNNLGNLLKDTGQLDEAVRAYRKAIEVDPDSASLHSNLLYALQFHQSCDARMILDEHRAWDRRHAKPLHRLRRPHDNTRDPNRPLRIGYVSPDLRQHPVGRLVLSLVRAHDRENFRAFCYSDANRADRVTESIRGCATLWRETGGIDDDRLAQIIREDQIDVLVDLIMHMSPNRLLVFAREPAPVQAAWAAYPGTTGLEGMDYRLTDPYLDPPGKFDEFYSERSIRLPHTFWCMDPADLEAVRNFEVNALPAESNGYVTFGCFNNFCKVNQLVLDLWRQTLDAVPNSRMVLLAPLGKSRDRVRRSLGDRVEFVALADPAAYMAYYHRVDIGLDTLPYNGHTTTIDSLWMGVPVLTIVGETVAGRAGFSQMSNLGLTEWIAATSAEFVEKAARFSQDLNVLAELRRTLRDRMRISPLLNSAKFAADIEAAYRRMWGNWCQSSA